MKESELGSQKSEYTAAHAAVRFTKEFLDPLDVTRELRLPYSHIHRNGEPRIRRRRDGSVHEYAPYKQGMWSMSSEGWVGSRELNDHVTWLLEQLEARKTGVRRLSESGVDIDIFCYSAGCSAEAPVLPNETRDRCKALSIDIGIDHYQLEDDE